MSESFFRRTALGVLAVISFFGGAGLLLFGPARDSYLALGASGVRIGLVLGAFWLAYPQLIHVPWWFVQAVLIGTLVIAVRPKLAAFVLPLLVVLWLVRPRKKKKNRKSNKSRSRRREPADPRPSGRG